MFASRYNEMQESAPICSTLRFVRSSSATTTPEYAFLALVIIAAAIATIGSLGHFTSSIAGNVGLASQGQVTRQTASEKAESDSAISAVPGYLSSWAAWTNTSSLLAVAITAAWLVFRRVPRQAAKPRALAVESSDTASDTAAEKRHRIGRRLYEDADTLLGGDIKIRHLMTQSKFTVAPHESVARATEIMEQNQLEYLLVCDPNQKLIGLVSHYFLLRTKSKRVVDAMMPNPLFVTADAMLSPTVTQMLNEGVSCVAVVDQGRAVGMVTTTDVKLTFQAALQVLARAKSERRVELVES